MTVTAGVGCDRLDPPTVATTSTTIVAATPNARPNTIAAGALHRPHGGWSDATDGCSELSTASGGGAGDGGDGGGTLDMSQREVRVRSEISAPLGPKLRPAEQPGSGKLGQACDAAHARGRGPATAGHQNRRDAGGAGAGNVD